MKKLILVTVAAVCAFVLLGCGDDDDAPAVDAGIDGGDADTDTDSDSDSDSDSDGDTITLSGFVVAVDMETRLEGVELCWNPSVGDPLCATTDEDGSYEIAGIVPDDPGTHELTKDGYVHYLFWRDSPTTNGEASYFYHTADEFEGLYTSAGLTMDAAKGTVVMQAVNAGFGGAVGATVSLTPESGVGPLYSAEGSYLEIDQDAGAITDTSIGMFANVDLGDYTGAVERDSTDCAPAFGTAPATLEVVADTISVITFVCP